jgi:pantoate--beta-alanine ligase
VEVFDHPDAMRAWSDARRLEGRRIGFVPTMGALHDGHLALVGIGFQHADVVVASIFVNPLQFDRPEDFVHYPRPLDDDLRVCADVGVNAVYAPTAAAMYPPGFQTFVEPGALAEPLEGAGRPGHFRGVATVVTKLLTAVRPDVAVFGQKDYQQLAVVRRLVADLDLGITIVGAPTVREGDGVALSSRNRRLEPQDRSAAVCIPRSLDAVAAAFQHGERDVVALEAIARALLDDEPRARVEYISIVDAHTLAPLEVVDRDAAVTLAVWFGDIRLIDNLVLTLDRV